MTSTLQYEFIKLAAQLADMKQEQYDELLTLTSLIAILIDKGVITQEDIILKKHALDLTFDSIIDHSHHPKE